MVENKETDAPIKRHEWERSHQVVVYNPTILICERCLCEYIGDRFVHVVVNYDIRAHRNS
jgi:hypothetical protein